MAQDTSNDVSWALYFFNSSCPCPPRQPVNPSTVVLLLLLLLSGSDNRKRKSTTNHVIG